MTQLTAVGRNSSIARGRQTHSATDVSGSLIAVFPRPMIESRWVEGGVVGSPFLTFRGGMRYRPLIKRYAWRWNAVRALLRDTQLATLPYAVSPDENGEHVFLDGE